MYLQFDWNKNFLSAHCSDRVQATCGSKAYSSEICPFQRVHLFEPNSIPDNLKELKAILCVHRILFEPDSQRRLKELRPHLNFDAEI